MATNNKINGVPAPLDTDVMDSADIRGIAQAVADNKTNIGLQQGKINAQVSYFKIGRLVVVNGVSSGAVSLSANIYTTVGVLPVGFRPIETFTFVFNTMGGELKGQSAQVLPSGDIRLYPKDIGQSYWQFTAVFVTN